VKRADFMRLCGRVAAWWPHSPWTDDAAAAYYEEDAKDLDGDQVATALRAWYRDEEKFPPNGAQLRAKVVALSIDAPDWAAVKRELCKPPSRWQPQQLTPCSHGRCDGDGWLDVADRPNTVKECPCRVERIAKARASQAHPLIREFADEVGQESLRDVWADRTAEAQVRTMWEQFVARQAQEAAYAGLPDAGLPAIERANRKGFGRIGDAIRSVLPAGSETA
jgi:hypothetical protein